MKSIRTSFRPAEGYHHTPLGLEFDELVAEATEKGLTRPNEEANRNVILAINDPNIRMQLTSHRISQELRKHLRSTIPQKQWLATVLIRDVLSQCQSTLQESLVELLEAVSVIAAMDTNSASEAAKNAKQVAEQILLEFGQERQRSPSGPQLEAESSRASVDRRLAPVAGPSTSEEPDKSIRIIQEVEETYRNQCELVGSLVVADNSRDLVSELTGEIRRTKERVIRAVETLGRYSGLEVERTICSGIEMIEMADRISDQKWGENENMELTLRDLAATRPESSKSADLPGERSDESKFDSIPRSKSNGDLRSTNFDLENRPRSNPSGSKNSFPWFGHLD